MDKQRIQDYWNLIQTLLNCPNGKEVEILHHHSNLVDEGLVSVMLEVAAWMAQEGSENANWLRDIAMQLAKKIGEPAWEQIDQRVSQLYHAGLYTQAFNVAKFALVVAQQIWDEEHSNVAKSLRNLAYFYQSQGHLADAETLLQEALAITTRLFPADHADVAISLKMLGLLYGSWRRLKEAELFLKKALAMRKRLFPAEHPDIAISLNDLAFFYQSQGRFAEAEPLYKQALEMVKRLFPDDHPNVATGLNNLAELYRSQGRLMDAEPLCQKALAMMKRLFPDDHPDVATGLNNLAELYRSQGRLMDAEPLCQQALAMMRNLFGEMHQNVVYSLSNLAALLAATHRYSEALDRMQDLVEIENRLISQTFAASSESDRLDYLQLFRDNFDAFLSLIYQHFSNSPHAIQTALDLILQRKCLTAAASTALNQAIHSGRYPHLQSEFTKLRQLSDQIIHYFYHEPRPDLIPQLQREHNQLQKQLAAQVPEIQLQDQQIDCQTVALELPEGSSLIEFVCFNVFDFHASNKESKWQPTRYLAFILPAGQPDNVQMRDLGAAKDINQLIQDFRRNVSDKVKAVQSLDMGGDDEEEEENEQPQPINGIELQHRIFAPLRPDLQPNQPLFLAPDGDFNLLPFDLLPSDETGETQLRDEYAISYLSGGRDILRSKIQTNRPSSPPLIIADPDFDLVNLTPPTPLPCVACFPEGVGRGEQDFLLHSKSDSPLLAGEGLGERSIATLTNSGFQRAEGTRRLGESIAKLLNIPPYFGKDALASHLTHCQSPELLVIATHGYFFKSIQQPDYQYLILKLLTCPNGQEATILNHNHKLLNETLLEEIETVATLLTKQGNPNPANWLRTLIPQIKAIIQSPQQPSTSHPEDPMLRSALAFAGANRWLAGKPLPAAAEKGMVFAQDIAALDLWETELAILSACQTGIGDVKLGEGVFGLRRAFAIAGTKTLIMSLWSVPDRATALLMNRFLSNLRQGLGRRVALKEAQDYIRTITVKQLQQSKFGRSILAELEKALPQTRQLHPTDQPLAHPYFWGAWVCQGETKAVKLNRL